MLVIWKFWNFNHLDIFFFENVGYTLNRKPYFFYLHQEFKRLALEEDICVFKELPVWHKDPNVKDNMEMFIRELLISVNDETRHKVLGVVYFGQDTEAGYLFDMIAQEQSKWGSTALVSYFLFCKMIIIYEKI